MDRKKWKPAVARMTITQFAKFRPQHSWAVPLGDGRKRTLQEWTHWVDQILRRRSR